VSPGAKLAVDITWTWPVMVALLALAMLPVWGPLLPPVEGSVMPVTTKVTFVDLRAAEGGMTARMSYVKNRNCEILGVSMDRNGVPVEFEPVQGSTDNMVTRGTGPQISRVWFIGDDSLNGLRLRFVHRCNPLFVTVTIAYP
jgi:hypothetical protein